MSDSDAENTASQFAKSSGVVLQLLADIDPEKESVPLKERAKPTRYLPVERISCFKEEKELLFAGEEVKFRINKIYRSETGLRYGHEKELAVLRNIQEILLNGNPQWTQDEIDVFIDFCERKNPRFDLFTVALALD